MKARPEPFTNPEVGHHRPGESKARRPWSILSLGSHLLQRGTRLAPEVHGLRHLLDRGWKEPRCVDACPTGALKFGEEPSSTWPATHFLRRSGAAPPVYYKNIPRPSSPVPSTIRRPKRSCKAMLTLTACRRGHPHRPNQRLGRLLVRDLGEEVYDLASWPPVMRRRVFAGLSTVEQSVNLGDIALR